MDDTAALRAAIDLIRVPSRVRALRTQPLPEGMELLLRVAAGDREAEAEAIALTNRSLAVIREAAFFFVEQILLSPDADNYRCLGARPNATSAELRRNMVLLLKGLHPDIARGDRALFARRVTAAWDQLKTPERRSAYDQAQQTDAKPPAKKKRKRSQNNWPIQHTLNNTSRSTRRTALELYDRGSEGLLRRTLRLILNGAR